MKLKYYLRGLGIGIIVTTLILMFSFSQRKESLSDEEIMARAAQLGMVMPEENSLLSDTETENSEETEQAKKDGQPEGTEALDEGLASEGTESLGEGLNPEGTIQSGSLGSVEDFEPNAGLEQPEETGQPPNGTENNNGGSIGSEGVYRLTIQKGMVCRNVCDELAANGLIEDSEALRKYLFEMGYANSMSTGEYDIPYGISMEEVAQILRNGPIEEE